MHSLIGREKELQSLQGLLRKQVASVVVVNGRRRIGKSSLIKEYGKSFENFYEFQGLSPRESISKGDQLENFAKQLNRKFAGPKVSFAHWYEAFSYLAEKCQRGRTLVLLDEISWMGGDDRDFAGTLKIVWDTIFLKNTQLVLALCGSVASWIEENILQSADFVGRVSLVIRLRELSLAHSAQMLGERFTEREKLQLLSVTGGVPKYLEEINQGETVTQNIKRLCFTEGGYLYEDFDRIFSDIFGLKSKSYKTIVNRLVNQRLSPSSLAKQLKGNLDGVMSKRILDLELSGFISQENSFSISSSKQSRLKLLRISDNYLRFYLRYIASNVARIKKGLFSFQSLDSLIAWDTIQGLQFETLIVNRLPEVIRSLHLENEQIIWAGPYFQTRTNRQQALQVDLLIYTRASVVFLCEIKFRKLIKKEVVREVQRKEQLLKVPKRTSVRPVLIYAGELEDRVKDEDYFDRVVDVGALLG